MEGNIIENIANKIASDETGADPYMQIDEQLDVIISSIMIIGKQLDAVRPETVEEKAKVEQMKELLNDGVAPYTADIAKIMDSFEVE
jgi:hypothetical protein